jgi:hypothetical protein
MSLAFVAGGVEYVRPDRSVFHAQWVRIDGVRSPVRVLDPVACRGHVLTNDDVQWFADTGRWPPPEQLAYQGRLWLRSAFDGFMRERPGRGGRPGLTIEQVRDIRTGYWSGDTKIADYFRCLGIGISTLKRIVNGRVYWWCGGGSPTWEGLSWSSSSLGRSSGPSSSSESGASSPRSPTAYGSGSPATSSAV